MTQSEQDIKDRLDQIETALTDIINHFGIKKNVVRLVDIRERARKDVERAKRNERKTPA